MYKENHDIEHFLKDAWPIAYVELETVLGSSPRESGTWMLVSPDRVFRTIGGGQLENLAIEEARGLFRSETRDPVEMRVPLGPNIGQCCGGTVNLRINLLDKLGLQVCVGLMKAELAELPEVLIFGAGHVGKALSKALSLLPVKPILIDTREAELAKAPNGIETRLVAMPEAEVRKARLHSAFVVLTHDHALDFLITKEALFRKDAAYVGLIGSRTKRATFRNWLRRETGCESGIEKLVCPIGNTISDDKRPEVIAALTAAEVMVELNKVIGVDNELNSEMDTQRVCGEVR